MTNPVFNNKENEFTKTEDGRPIFISRSIAVCVPVTAQTSDGKIYDLISQRGSGTPNYQYHYNLVCGYLDHNEDLHEAARRELFEETGLDVSAIPKQNVIYNIEQRAWSEKSKPDHGMQNVTMRYGLYLKFDNVSQLPMLSNEHCEENEVIESLWIERKQGLRIPARSDGIDPQSEKVWAFNHFDVYREWIDKVQHLENGKPIPAIVTVYSMMYILLFASATNNNVDLLGTEMIYAHITGGLAWLLTGFEVFKRWRRGSSIFKNLFTFKF